MKTLSVTALATSACLGLGACAFDSPWADFGPPEPVLLGFDTFDFNRDREVIEIAGVVPGADAIAIRPLDGDARCSRVTARFAYGPSQDLAIDARQYLVADRDHWLDLPGDDRSLIELEMACRPVGRDPVTMQVLASR
jgi:hypothetical protein